MLDTEVSLKICLHVLLTYGILLLLLDCAVAFGSTGTILSFLLLFLFPLQKLLVYILWPSAFWPPRIQNSVGLECIHLIVSHCISFSLFPCHTSIFQCVSQVSFLLFFFFPSLLGSKDILLACIGKFLTIVTLGGWEQWTQWLATPVVTYNFFVLLHTHTHKRRKTIQ